MQLLAVTPITQAANSADDEEAKRQRERDKLIAALVAAFALTAANIHALEAAIYDGLIAAAQAAYVASATSVGVPLAVADAWQPSDALLSQFAAQALADAERIAATYASALEREIAAAVEAFADAHDGSLAGAQASVTQQIASWADERAATRSQLIATYETGVGQHQATQAFIDEALAQQQNENDENGTLLTDATGDPLDLSAAVVVILPDDSSPDECADYAGETFSLDDFADLPSFPMHLSCQHGAYVMLSNGDEWNEWNE